MNPNSEYSAEDSLRDLIHTEPQEAMDTAGEPTPEDIDGSNSGDDLPYDGGGWPGDGSGTDDLADYNANEADDYTNE